MSRAIPSRSGKLDRAYAGAIAPSAGSAGALLAQYSLRLGDTILRHRAEIAERASRIEAELASQVKSDFIANISHELRSPLNSILGFSKMLKGSETTPLEPAQVAEYADFILGSAESLLSIVNDIITISKLQSGKFSFVMDTIDVDVLLAACASLAHVQAEAANHRFVSQIDEGLPPIWADQERLKDVLIRLLTNAIRFTPAGGTIALTAKLRPDDTVMICVSDSGIGMTDREITVALTAFGQIDNRLDRQHEGTGLGLPIAKALVELQGGTFILSSEKDEGTHVVLLFPQAPETHKPPQGQEKPNVEH